MNPGGHLHSGARLCAQGQPQRLTPPVPARAAQAGNPYATRAFSLLEVMIALGIFFMAVFTILALVSTTLRNARALQRPLIDAGMVAAQYMNTNKFSEGTVSGDFEDPLQDYSYQVETVEAATNGLLRAGVVLHRRGLQQPADMLEIFVYDPSFRSTPFPGGNSPLVRPGGVR